MKTIQPTPSQAAVVLKRFLNDSGIDFKLGQAQEAIARIYGYADWNTLATDIPVRGTARNPKKGIPERSVHSQPVAGTVGTCKRCGSHLPDQYCADSKCVFHHWPQCVGFHEVDMLSQDTLERYHGIRKRDKRGVPAAPLSIDYFQQQCPVSGREDLKVLEQLLHDELLNTGLLHGWQHQHGRGECALEEGGSPLIEVSFTRRLSPRFSTELVFSLRDQELKCYVRTWEHRDELEESRDYDIFNERSGDFDTDAESPDPMADLSVLVATALAEADLHKTRLLERVNVK